MYCQVVYICGCIPARIQHALAELPETLDETYQRTLREINKADWEYAHRLFQFVAVASRPLRVEELAELLAFDFKAEPIPKFNEDWRLEDPADAVLSTCSSFLAVVDSGYIEKVIQFAHFSVKEFLTSARLVEADDITFRRYHVSIPPAHTLVAKACLGILLHLDENVTSDSLEEWHFAKYAAEYWADHVKFGGVSQNVEDGLKQLFDPRNPHLAVCVWIHDPRGQSRQLARRAKRPMSLIKTFLHYAALWGLHFIVDFLIIERSQNVRFQGFTDNVTPLHLASERGHVKTALVLIDHGASVMVQNEDGRTPLHLASRKGQVEVGRMLIERGADVTAQNANGETPLHLASEEEHVEVARMLIERGADVTARNANGVTPLHLASQLGQLEVARMLIQRGADVTVQNANGETPLHLASQRGQLEVTRMFIQRGADVTAQNAKRETPLHLASQRGQLEVARMLIEHGADVTAQNAKRETPLHLALQWSRLKVARMLIERGADVTAQNANGETPLHLASKWGQLEVARMLIEHGADVTAQNANEETPLHLASQRGQLEVACMLIERGADVTAQNKFGRTPFHLAAQEHMGVARVLIEHGTTANAQNNDGGSPFCLVLQDGFAEITLECDIGPGGAQDNMDVD